MTPNPKVSHPCNTALSLAKLEILCEEAAIAKDNMILAVTNIMISTVTLILQNLFRFIIIFCTK